MEEKNKNVMHICSLVLGIISIVFDLFWYIALPTGILSIVFGAKSARLTGSKIGKAGMVTGIIGLSLSVFMYISMILIIVVENI